MELRDLLAIITLILAGGTYFAARKKNKKDLRNLHGDLKALLGELQINSVGKGSKNYPFHFFVLEKVIENKLFKNKYPNILLKLSHLLALSSGKMGVKPGQVQSFIKEVIGDINGIISSSYSS